MKSQASASSRRRQAKPFTMAIQTCERRLDLGRHAAAAKASAESRSSQPSAMSAPATKAFSPAPVRITTRASPASTSWSSAASALRAFSFSRLMADGQDGAVALELEVFHGWPRRNGGTRVRPCAVPARHATYWRGSGHGRCLSSPSSLWRTSAMARQVLQADQVGELERAPTGRFRPSGAPSSVLDRAEPFVEGVAGLVEERDQDPVHDEAGMSPRTIVVLPKRSASCTVIPKGLLEVGRPRTTSTSFMSGTGFMKCMPIRAVGPASRCRAW